MEQRVESLLTTLAEHNIPIPPQTPFTAASSPTGHVVVGAQDENIAGAHVSLSFHEAATTATTPMEITPQFIQPPQPASHPEMLTNPGAGFLSENRQQTLLKDPRVGIDFILA